MNQDQQDKDITEVVETTSNNATIQPFSTIDEIKLEELEEIVGGSRTPIYDPLTTG